MITIKTTQGAFYDDRTREDFQNAVNRIAHDRGILITLQHVNKCSININIITKVI